MGLGYDDGNKAFANGEGLMMINGNWAINQFTNSNAEFKCGMFAFPASNDEAVNYVTSGVDGFVTVFATFPIAMFLSEKAGIPRRMIPAILMLSCGANSAPFVLSINNIISMSVLHTSPGAAAIPGFICFIVIEVGVYLICVKCTLSAIKKGETFEKGNVHLPAMDMSAEKPSMVLSLIPLIVVFILFATVGNASLALVVGILVAVILMHKYIPASGEASASGVGAFMGKVIGTLNDGAGQGASAVMTLSAAAGFAAVVQHTQAFNAFVGIIFGLPLPHLYKAKPQG